QEEAARIMGVPLAQLVSDDRSQPGSKSKARSLSFLAEALLLIHNHPDWTIAKYTQQLGWSRSKLFRNPHANQALKERKAPSNRPPAGFKDADGDGDSYD